MAGINQLESLRVFCTVVECGSFTAAAKKIGVSSAWVSKSVDSLESRLGETLLLRNTRRIQVTENGEQCYLKGIEILQKWNDLEISLTQAQRQPKGKLKISAPVSWGLTELEPILINFIDKYPEIDLDMQLSDQYVNLLKDKFDLALRLTDELPNSTLLCKKITTYKRILCATPAYLKKFGEPSQPYELKEHSCLVYSFSDSAKKWEFNQAGNKSTIYLEPKLASNNSKLIHSTLLADQGIALIPSFLVKNDLENDRLVCLLPEFQPNPLILYTLRPQEKTIAYKLEVFIEHLNQYFMN